MNSPYLQAQDLGFTDDKLMEHFTKEDPDFPVKYQKAIELNYKPEEIYNKAHASYRAKKQPFSNQDVEEEDHIDKEIERHTARLTSRGLEQVAGAPGNIRDLAYAIKDIFKNTKEFKQLEKNGVKEPESFKKIEEAIPVGKTVSNLLGYLPTSKQLKKFSEEKSQGYTSPKDENERIGDEVFERLVSSALPGQGPRNIWRNVATPIVSVLGKEAVKYMGGGDKSQALTDLGLNIAVPLMSGNAPQLNRNLWKDLRQNIPNVNVNTNQLLQKARDLEAKIAKGLGSRSETQATTTLNRLIKKLERGQISADELMASNISLNEIVGDPELFGRGAPLFAEIRGIIQDGMEKVGQQAPDWYKQWQHANEVHGAIANSNHIANVIRKHSEPMVSEGARAIFHAAAHGTAKAAATIPPVYAIYKGVQVFERMAHSPVLMQYYTNILKNALRGNFNAMSENIQKLDDAFLKEEKKESFKPPFKTSSQKK
jgi:hypothetical protein